MTAALCTDEPFWKTLSELKRERLFAIMRRLGDEMLYYFDRGREAPNTIPVGAALFDDVVRGALRHELVSALRTASSPESAFDQARAALRVWVQKHNERRNDINWKRWEDTGQIELETQILEICKALED